MLAPANQGANSVARIRNKADLFITPPSMAPFSARHHERMEPAAARDPVHRGGPASFFSLPSVRSPRTSRSFYLWGGAPSRFVGSALVAFPVPWWLEGRHERRRSVRRPLHSHTPPPPRA